MCVLSNLRARAHTCPAIEYAALIDISTDVDETWHHDDVASRKLPRRANAGGATRTLLARVSSSSWLANLDVTLSKKTDLRRVAARYHSGGKIAARPSSPTGWQSIGHALSLRYPNASAIESRESGPDSVALEPGGRYSGGGVPGMLDGRSQFVQGPPFEAVKGRRG